MNKKLYKSSRDKMLSGVCGGIGVYFNIDSTLVRLLWAFLTLCSCGTGILAYIVAAIIIPDDEIIQ
ncbi:MAG: PspC domain-containing protein [Eubacterium sp.]|jgi:phage shock protein C|nr:PspC domain-containing protein [Eubacterium sp.]